MRLDSQYGATTSNSSTVLQLVASTSAGLDVMNGRNSHSTVIGYDFAVILSAVINIIAGTLVL